ncbi:Ig-like domain-containing protein [Rheinheimera sp. YQF-2]|uniref:Ig-like domain-containing protein n=1 Tax=Rheinheimera lutimaris TaxID=2740584 RepID=A0A7Y5APZ7_9GAMM|nr:Ig-like domain-containing protein [Rheinheimera lutimaris]NRQ42367.1 Ig-like domain-containing protein [Rheinheimera lutimaris]
MRNIRQLFVALIVTTLAACGGGGTLDSDGGTGGGNTPVYSLALTLADASGTASSDLAQATPLTLTATLRATNGGVISGQVINFALSDEQLATFGNAAGTALTNDAGVASLQLLVGSRSGAGNVTATYESATAAAGFVSLGGDGAVTLIADTLQLGSGASGKVELTALVRDSSNVVVSGVPVVFSSDSGELDQLDTTTVNGIVRAVLTTQTDKNNRDIVVTAKVQQQTSEITISVIGTSIEIASPGSVVLGDTATIDVFLTDSNDSGIANTTVEVTSALGNTIINRAPVTAGAAGKATFTYEADNPGADTITVSALGTSNSVTLNVSPDEFAFLEAVDEGDNVLEVNLNTAQALDVEWLVSGAANAGENVTFNTTRGAIADIAANLANNVTAQDTTDAAGRAQTVVRSQFAGLATISATGGTGAGAVSAKKVVEFVAVNPTKIEAQAFPTQVGAGESSAIRAIVRDANNNPVKNQTVVFSVDNAAGGVISTGTADTNSQGIASTVFTADNTTGAGVNGLNLVVKAALEDNNAIFDEANIAVGDRSLFFRFGTGNTITKPSDSTYSKQFSIIVTDSSGNPVANQALNVAVSPVAYRKGVWVESPPAPAAFKSWATQVSVVDGFGNPVNCVNEDANLNGVLDAGEDINADGILTPGNPVAVPGTVTANDTGIAEFVITYPQDVGGWLDVRLQVSGFAAGTENVAHRVYSLPVSSEDITDENSRPPANPYGSAASCAIAD